MKVYIDLDALKLIRAPGTRDTPPLSFKRGDSAEIQIVFLSGGVTPTLMTGCAFLFGCKEPGKYDATTYVVSSDVWTAPSDPGDYTYRCAPSFNNDALNALLKLNDNPSDDPAGVTLMGEISWVDGAGRIFSTATFVVAVANDVIRGTEGAPTGSLPDLVTAGMADQVYQRQEPDGGTVWFKDGKHLYVYCPDDGLYYPAGMRLVAGIPTWVPGGVGSGIARG